MEMCSDTKNRYLKCWHAELKEIAGMYDICIETDGVHNNNKSAWKKQVKNQIRKYIIKIEKDKRRHKLRFIMND